MKRILLLAFLILSLAGCTEIVEVPGETIIVEVEKPVYIEKEIIELVEVEVIPEGYVDSYYYCHEDEVLELLDALFWNWAEYPNVTYVEGEDPTYWDSSITLGTETLTAWDIMLEYCSFDHTNDRDGGI